MAKTKPSTEQLQALNVAVCTCANLRKASRIVTQAYDNALHPAGLKATQFTLLATLDQWEALPLTKLAQAMVMDRTTLTRNLKPLVSKGFVRIDQDKDQRVRRISLTEMGKDTFQAALPLWQTAQSRLVSALGHQRWSGFIGDLSQTVHAIQKQ